MKKVNRIIAIVLAVIMIISLSACNTKPKKSELALEMINQMQSGMEIKPEVALPSAYQITINGAEQTLDDWVQLNQLKTYNKGFRQDFDTLFNIYTISDKTQDDVSAKQGCLFTINENGIDFTDGNTTLADAFRNKVFVEQYWGDVATRTEIGKLSENVYKDYSSISAYTTEASLNTYYNLFAPYSGDNFNPTKPLFRNEFYAFLTRATQPVHELDRTSLFGEETLEELEKIDTSAMSNDEKTELNNKIIYADYIPYVRETEKYGFLNLSNKGLNATTLNNPISRVEAIYMIVNMIFPELLAQADENATAFSDTQNTGNMAAKIGFIGGSSEADYATPMWQVYTLAYMMKNTDKGMPSELYKAMVVASQLGLIPQGASRWNEGISRVEAMNLLINAELAKNKIDGYATTTEYAELKSETSLAGTQDTRVDNGATAIDASSSMEDKLEELTDYQIEIFKATAEMNTSKVKSGDYTADDAEAEQIRSIEINIEDGYLPVNARQLFQSWKKLNGYYSSNYSISSSSVIKEDYEIEDYSYLNGTGSEVDATEE